MKEVILTSNGWYKLEDVDVTVEQCIDCGEEATRAVYIGLKRHSGEELYWCQCDACAGEVDAAGRDGAYRSEQELDYYSGRD
jgi:hypothetical protein